MGGKIGHQSAIDEIRPEGATGSCASLVTAMRRNRRWPAATAVTTAVRSAQMVPPYDAFSTLQPV